MSEPINYQNNPLHGLSLTNMLQQLVDHYGFEILYAYLQINCFNKRATVESSILFLKKTQWAREKCEIFYLYNYKSMPRPSSEQFALPPRDRIFTNEQQAGAPKELSFEDAEQLQQKIQQKAKAFRQHPGNGKPKAHKARANQRSRPRDDRNNTSDSKQSAATPDPWAKWQK